VEITAMLCQRNLYERCAFKVPRYKLRASRSADDVLFRINSSVSRTMALAHLALSVTSMLKNRPWLHMLF